MAGFAGRAGVFATLEALLHKRLAFLWLIYLLGLVIAGAGASKIQFDDGLVGIFESKIDRYTQFAEFEAQFETDSSDIVVVLTSADFAAPEALTAVSDFLIDVQFIAGVGTTLSPLVLPAADGSGRLVPSTFPPQDVMAARFERDWAASPNLRRMLSRDRRTMLAVVSIPDVVEDITRRRATIEAISDVARQVSVRSSIDIALTGYPVLRQQMAEGLISDAALLTVFGATVGLTVTILTLRSLHLGLLTFLSPSMSLLWVYGMLGHLGVQLNIITIILPMLVLVLATSDALHITIETARQTRATGALRPLRSVRRIAPACILSALTSAVAFAALTLSRSTMIAEMGLASALAAVLSVMSVLVTQSLVMTAAGRFWTLERLFGGTRGTPPDGLSLRSLPSLAAGRPRLVATASLLGLAVAASVYLTAEPRYSLYDNLHRHEPALIALKEAEEKVAPITALHIPLATSAPESIVRVHAAVVAATSQEGVLSLASFGIDGVDIPEALLNRFAPPGADRAIVTVLFPYENSETTRQLAERLSAKLARDETLSGIELAPPTGLPVMSAYVSHAILTDLNASFLAAIGASALLVGLWFRSLRLALVALVPNLLPATIIGALFVLSGQGLGFPGGLALTVTFALAVDDTLHVLNRLRLTGAIRAMTPAGIAAAMREVAPALVVTSIVLISGLAGTLFAATTAVAEFGVYAIIACGLALLADLVTLPALLIFFRRRG